MAVNKVEVNGETKLDLTQDTVTPENLLSGATAHNSAGVQIVGKYQSVTLTGLEITAPPKKTAYLTGETFDPAGMVVTATYSNGGETGEPCVHGGPVWGAGCGNNYCHRHLLRGWYHEKRQRRQSPCLLSRLRQRQPVRRLVCHILPGLSGLSAGGRHCIR